MQTSEKQVHRTWEHRAASPLRGAYPCASRGGASTIFSVGGSEADSGLGSCSFRPTAAASSRTTCAATLSSWARAAVTKDSLEALVSISSSSTTPSSRSAIFSSLLARPLCKLFVLHLSCLLPRTSEVLLVASTKPCAAQGACRPARRFPPAPFQEVREHVVVGKPRASRDQPAALRLQPAGHRAQCIPRCAGRVRREYDLDHLTIGNPSLLTDSGAPLWGKPVWGKGKEERGTGELGSYRK